MQLAKKKPTLSISEEEDKMLYWYHVKPATENENKMEEEYNYTKDMEFWQNYDVNQTLLAEKPTFVGDPVSKQELKLMYQCTNPRESLEAFTRIVKARRGNFPPPNWFEYMIASQYLNACFHTWSTHEDKESFQNWVDVVYRVRPGKMIGGYVELAGGKHEREVDTSELERPTKMKK